MSTSFSQRVLRWYRRHGRQHLPWQNPITPYRVWVSEIMLQQTQVETVIPYFERFMSRFPEVSELAAAPIDELLHLWTGLGYYARARNLHKAAQVLVREHGGDMPADRERLQALPGIGRSTAAAIASLAFNQPTAILDGNVKRVLARHAAVEGWPGQTAVAKRLWAIAEQRMPARRCRDYTQAMMDLGATLCTRSRPACERCPVRGDCRAYENGQVEAYPASKPKKTKPIKRAYLLIVSNPQGEILLEQRPARGIWGGLWSFPELALDADPAAHIERFYGPYQSLTEGASLRHSFSHYHFDILPLYAQLQRHPRAVFESGGQLWYNLHRPPSIGLAAPVKTLLNEIHQRQPTQSTLAL